MPHIHDLYDFTASAYIIHSDHILLIHHKVFDSWVAPGGHVELDEDPVQAMWRETEEETGLAKDQLRLYGDSNDIPATKGFYTLPLPFHMFVVDYNGKPGHKHIDFSYLLEAKSDKIKHAEREAHGIGWYSMDQVKAMHKEGTVSDAVLSRVSHAVVLAKAQAAAS